MQINIENRGEYRTYAFIREERYQFQGLHNENYIEAQLKVTLVSYDNNIPVFRVEMPFYKQSNKDGMYKWVGDLYELRENIICTLNEDGQLGNIQNWKIFRKNGKK